MADSTEVVTATATYGVWIRRYGFADWWFYVNPVGREPNPGYPSADCLASGSVASRSLARWCGRRACRRLVRDTLRGTFYDEKWTYSVMPTAGGFRKIWDRHADDEATRRADRMAQRRSERAGESRD